MKTPITRMFRLVTIQWIVLLTFICGGLKQTSAFQPASPIKFVDATSSSGIDFVHSDGSYGKRYIVETLASGLAVFDYDLDGDDDIYFLSAVASGKEQATAKKPGNRLYRNDGTGVFNDVTEQAGVGDLAFSLGIAVGDFDNDGWPDFYVNNFGRNRLYQNCGDGRFREVSHQIGVQCGEEVGAGVCFLDVNNDGLLDLYVANYVQFSIDKHVPTIVNGIERYSSPKVYPAEGDRLFLNDGSEFKDVTQQSGIGKHVGTGMGVIAFDVDDDFDQDIVVMNDVRPNFLWLNDGKGVFEEVGLQNGIAYNYQGNVLGSMGIDAADYDHDGFVDLFQTSFFDELPVLRKNFGLGVFEDVTRNAGFGLGLTAHTNWGTCFADFDNDTFPDLFIANGNLFDNVAEFDERFTYEEPNKVFRNDHKGRFVDVTATCGPALGISRSSRGSAVSDLNGDGQIDIVVLNARTEPTVLLNSTNAKRHWLKVSLHGIQNNRDGVGAKVSVTTNASRTNATTNNTVKQTQVIHSGRGYQSHWGSTLHFGLGDATAVDEVEVIWPNGHKQTVSAEIAIDSQIRIIESSPNE